MKQYYIRQVLTGHSLQETSRILREADERNAWEDGLVSVIGKGKKAFKNNLELSDINLREAINTNIMSALDHDLSFLNYTVPATTTPNIISKTPEGGYYNPHHDEWFNGNFSTSVFLNDPSEYDGGELCLDFGDREYKFKLDAGWAISYSTGLLHRVNHVTRGARYASVFWTKSLIRDEFARHMYTTLGEIMTSIDKTPENCFDAEYEEEMLTGDCGKASLSPMFRIDGLRKDILRKYAVTYDVNP